MNIRKLTILLLHALAGWILCAATMGVGMAVVSLEKALVIHAIGAPIFFAIVSWAYFSRFDYTKPLATASFFTGFVIVLDFFVVGMLINRSLSMFSSLLGTWIPFGLIFISTLVSGTMVRRAKHATSAKHAP